MKDIFGRALLDYFQGDHSEDIVTSTNISEEDELPLPYLFRDFDTMPNLEKTALELCRGNVLDVGCGAGSHALWLQDRGFKVKAIDTSAGAVEVCRERGVNSAEVEDLLDTVGTFDTILLLMNGTGIFQTVERSPLYLKKLKSLLAPGGQILIDSSDLRYMYDSNSEGGILVPGDRYYGELDYTISYKGEVSDPFPMLYLDKGLLRSLCEEVGLNFELVIRGNHFDYLARLSR